MSICMNRKEKTLSVITLSVWWDIQSFNVHMRYAVNLLLVEVDIPALQRWVMGAPRSVLLLVWVFASTAPTTAVWSLPRVWCIMVMVVSATSMGARRWCLVHKQRLALWFSVAMGVSLRSQRRLLSCRVSSARASENSGGLINRSIVWIPWPVPWFDRIGAYGLSCNPIQAFIIISRMNMNVMWSSTEGRVDVLRKRRSDIIFPRIPSTSKKRSKCVSIYQIPWSNHNIFESHMFFFSLLDIQSHLKKAGANSTFWTDAPLL